MIDPYFVPTYKALPITLVKGEGSWVFDSEGRKYLDMYAGHAVTSTGHCHPTVVKAIQDQASQLIFYSSFLKLEVREKAAKRLVESSPEGLSHALFVNSGAEANENAAKIATLRTGRKKFISFEGSFHGRTLLALHLTAPEKYRATAPAALDVVSYAKWGEPPEVTEETAAVILEPIQSMAGCRGASPEFYQETARRCRQKGAMLIYDEVQTGFGRTGSLFFAGRHGVVPDMVTLAKGIGSGIPLGAVLVQGAIAEKLEYGQFGATYGAGPIAMAAMDATLRVIQEEKLLANVKARSAQLFGGLSAFGEPRGLGLLIGLKVKPPAREVSKALREKGVIVGGSDNPNVLRLLPPLTLSEDEADLCLKTFQEVLA